ncbi:hypothetical protein V8Z80_08600 [Orrella sp. JC864]|uniref:phage head spike fiber domain-containing protein n=1 Tax=Orrella sp. JC864 TaxID=3120298 RepID=UPI0030085CE2
MSAMGPVSILARFRDPQVLDFDFTQGEMPAGWTFTRGSLATYIDGGALKTAAQNEPVFEDGALRLEPQRTNYIQRNAGQDIMTWTTTRAILREWGAFAGMTMRRWAATAGYNSHYVNSATVPTGTIAVGTVLSGQVCVKAGGLSQCRVEMYLGTGYFHALVDLTSGDIVGTGGDQGTGTVDVTRLADGVFRIRMNNVARVDGPTSSHMRVLAQTPDFQNSFDGNEVDGLWVGGAQIEIGPECTSFIPNETAGAITRLRDIALLTLDQPWGVNPGTLVADFTSNPRGVNVFISLREGEAAAGNRIEIRRQVTEGRTATIVRNAAGGTEISNGSGYWPPGQEFNRAAFGWGIPDLKFVSGGAITLASTRPLSAWTPANLREIMVPHSSNNYGRLRRIRLYRHLLSDSALEAITA